MSNRPIIAVTMGDPAGIGPEVILKALADPVIKKVSRPLILGDWGVLQRTRRRQRNAPPLICWQQGQPLLPLLNHRSAHVVCSLSTLTVRESRPGIASRAGGHGGASAHDAHNPNTSAASPRRMITSYHRLERGTAGADGCGNIP